MKPPNPPRPGRRQQRRDAIKQLLIAQDASITSVEFFDDPWPTSDSEVLVSCDVWLYRKGQTPFLASVVADLADNRIVRMERFETQP